MNKLITLAVGVTALLISHTGQADVVHADDVVITGSECVGLDCVNGEVFGFDTIRLKENNLRIGINDTSTGSFPTNDWQLTFNDSASGGASYFSVDDVTGGKVPFKVTAGAPTNSLFISSSGRLGLGTATPVLNIHITSGDTPATRLEQNGNSGYTAQTWDIAGNEANFFVRDVTGGSKLPFRIRPGAPTSSIDIAASGNVGIGTASPAWAFHINRSGTIISQTQSSDNGAVQQRLKTNSSNRRVIGLDSTDTVKSQIVFGDNEIKLAGQTDSTNLYARLDATGLFVNGSISTAASGQVHPDYVFKENYQLMPLAKLKNFVKKNSHLPEIPSAAEVAQKGLNLTEMQILLLKKVEELTLYTLEQQDVINDLKAKVSELEKSSP